MSVDGQRSLWGFLAFGFIETLSSPESERWLRSLGDHLALVQVPDLGYFFYTLPSYADIAVKEDVVGVKLGLLRSGDEFVSTSTAVDRDWIAPHSVQYKKMRGDVLMLCFSRDEPCFCAYASLLSTSQLYYWSQDGCVLCTDNLRLMADLLERPQLNQTALPMHFLFRSVPGRQTYLEGVYCLCPGERMAWHDGDMTVTLCQDLRALFVRERYSRVEPESVDHYYSQFSSIVHTYINQLDADDHRVAVLLSGGIDSSILQMAVSDSLCRHRCSLSMSYVADAPSFAPEVDNARDAALFFGTDHTFVPVKSSDFPDLLMTAIDVLGQPPHHEQTAYYIPVARSACAREQGIRYLLSGEPADTFHGLAISRDMYSAFKYRRWPVSWLRLLGLALEPFWHSKAYGARRAADILSGLDDPDSPAHPLNSLSMYTDWVSVCRCFGSLAASDALACRRELEQRYLDSPNLIEKVHALHLLSDMHDSLVLWRQLGLASGQEMIFPYFDDTVVEASFEFAPEERYFLGGRTKPVLKMVLERRGAAEFVNRPKYGGGWGNDLPRWMAEGVLRDMVQAIERPAFMERADFARKIAEPDWFTWNLLTLDLFSKRILRHDARKG